MYFFLKERCTHVFEVVYFSTILIKYTKYAHESPNQLLATYIFAHEKFSQTQKIKVFVLIEKDIIIKTIFNW